LFFTGYVKLAEHTDKVENTKSAKYVLKQLGEWGETRMIDIIVLIFLTNHIGNIVESKGYKRGKYRWMTVGLWFAGEIIGFVIAGLLSGMSMRNNGAPVCFWYIVGLVGASLGAWIAVQEANDLKPLPGFPKPEPSELQTDSTKES
jgi:MFS family permease